MASLRASVAVDAKAAESLTAAEKAQVTQVFAKLDKNGDGTLDKMELIVGLRDLKHPSPTLATVEELMAAVGLEDADDVTVEEFEIMWKNKPAEGGWDFASASLNSLLAAPSALVGGLAGGLGSLVSMAAAAAGADVWVESGDENPKGKPITGVSYRKVYTLGKKVGSGAYSSVYLAQKVGEAGDYAVKVVQKKDVPDKEDIEALLEEVGILQQIHHPHVMRLFEFYEDAESYALVTEMVVGGELFDRVVELQHYSEHTARDLVVILLRTLHFLHSNGIVHRDLKPENLLLADKHSDTNIKLADFGFAKHTSQRLDTVCGTPDYIAPEVCALLDLKKVPRSERPPYNELCDIWSAGVIIFILLGGYPPFYDDNRKALFGKIKRGEYEFHEQYWGEVSPDAKDLISQMLTVDPAKRPSAAALLQHPWLAGSEELLRSRRLGATQDEIKKWVARRRLKAAAAGLIAVRRMGGLVTAGAN